MKKMLLVVPSLLTGVILVNIVIFGQDRALNAQRMPVGRVVFREIQLEMMVRDSVRESAKASVFVGTDGVRSYILFDRSGNTGRSIVEADCKLMVNGSTIAVFQISHSYQGSRTMFSFGETEAVSRAISKMGEPFVKKEETISLHVSNVFLK